MLTQGGLLQYYFQCYSHLPELCSVLLVLTVILSVHAHTGSKREWLHWLEE